MSTPKLLLSAFNYGCRVQRAGLSHLSSLPWRLRYPKLRNKWIFQLEATPIRNEEWKQRSGHVYRVRGLGGMGIGSTIRIG